MGGAVYRIPSTGLHLWADGSVGPKPAAGTDVVTVRPVDAPRLSAAYVGRSLQLLSTRGGAGVDATKEALERVKEGAEIVVLVGEVVKLGIELAEFLGAFEHQPDPIMLSLERLDARLGEIEDLVLASWTSSRRDQLALLRTHSATALRIVQEYMELDRPDDPVWASKVALAERDSLFAAKAFTDGGIDGAFWLRPFSLRALGLNPNSLYNSWMWHHPDRATLLASPGRLVWDYRFTLPAAAYAIVVRMAVLKAVSPRSLQSGAAGCRELKTYARFLRAVIERIQGGIWFLDRLAEDKGSRFQFQWRGRAPVAAGQIHSGFGFYHLVHAYEWEHLHPSNPGHWPPNLIEPFLSFEQVDANIRAVGTHWWSLVWNDIGLRELCMVISDVDGACTLPIFTRLVGEAQRRSLLASTDVTARSAASVAAGLSQLTSTGDGVDDAVRTSRFFDALQLDAGQAVVRRAAEALLELAHEEAPADPRPVSWWRGEQNARDAAGDNHGRVDGAVTFAALEGSHAFAFGPDGCVEVPSAPSLEPDTLTLVAWVRRDSAPEGAAYLVSKGATGCVAASYALFAAADSHLRFAVADGEHVASSPPAGAVWDGRWHFVAGTFDGEAVALFVDGAEVERPVAAGLGGIGYQTPDGDALYLGAYRGTCRIGFDGGALDEVRLFDHALSAGDLRALYDAELGAH